MFPYPSGRLHMGHLRVYTLSDALSRYYALKGFKVLHPIGWDAFGLPAENAAIQRGIDPADWTFRNINDMRNQLLQTGINFDWDRELFTCHPDYFRWTQWIFLQLFKNGLVRKAFSEVNWDPVDKTVLADEQVDIHGRSWRSNALVEKRRLHQWVIDTPRYAKRLLDGLSNLQFEWSSVAAIQNDWIGICDVYRFLLPIECQQVNEQLDLRIEFPTQLCSAQFVLLKESHHIAKNYGKNLQDSQLFAPIDDLTVFNFVTNQQIPLIVVRDSEINEEDQTPFYMNCRLGSSMSASSLDRLISENLAISKLKAVAMNDEQILNLAESLGFGGYQTSRKLRDWVVSRQRSWGTPIPMLTDGNNVAPVPENCLPILGEQRGQRMEISSLPSGFGQIEEDTLDTYFDSSWYFLRFLDPNNQKMPFDPEIAHRQMPVSVYVGGAEHALMHLFFARFICHFLHGIGLIPCAEPFARFISLGVVRSRSFQLINDGKYVPAEEVEGDPRSPDNLLMHRPTGEMVRVRFEKMSKSKLNGVDPLELIEKYGKDLTRLQLLFEARPNMPIDWPYPYPTFQAKSLKRWLELFRTLVDGYINKRMNANDVGTQPTDSDKSETVFRDIYNKHVKAVSMYMEVLRYHNTALIRLIDMTKAVNKEWSANPDLAKTSPELERCLFSIVVMAQIFAPDAASQQWKMLQKLPNLFNKNTPWRLNESLDKQSWPKLDDSDNVDIVLCTFGTLFLRQAPRKEVEDLNDAGVERYARLHSHVNFFDRLAQQELKVLSWSVERLPGLCIVLNLKMAEDVKKRAITEIIQKYSGKEGSRRGKKDKKEENIELAIG
uniref:leucine--tRNA ligase n=1 Tax=Meloidogyne hapla TaxID=6305 RepID=A0A1I8AZN0_MELHA